VHGFDAFGVEAAPAFMSGLHANEVEHDPFCACCGGTNEPEAAALTGDADFGARFQVAAVNTHHRFAME
jgi:hypothetical protein